MSFNDMQVPQLKQYLQDRGVTCSIYRKNTLIRLCEVAKEINLEVIPRTFDEDQYKSFDIGRRSVNIDGEKVVLIEVEKVQGWTKNLSSLPDIELGDVLVYLYTYCGWDDGRMKQYKFDNGYKLNTDNHIHDVEMHLIENTSFLYIRSSCIPETKQNEAPYKTWILLNKDGNIHSGGCSCVADNGTCKHCVALLFSASSFCDRHKDRFTETCTDIECVWDKPKKTSQPMEVDDIDIRMDKTMEKVNATPTNYVPHVNCLNMSDRQIEKEMFDLFKGTDALVLQTLSPSSDTESDDDENTIPTIADIVTANKATDSDLVDKLKSVFTQDVLKSVFTQDVLKSIEVSTRGQTENPDWFTHRNGRITASLFSSVLHFKFSDAPDNYILKTVLGKRKNIDAPSLTFGKQNEPVARQMYIDLLRQRHRSFKVEKCGLFVDEQYPFMGASPDGVVSCSCCGKGLIEIKCSFMHKNVTPKEACTDDHYHVYLDENNDVRLKVSSPWYCQIQGQLGVCKLKWCDFVFFTRKGIAIDRIYYDSVLFEQITTKCTKFFNKYIVNALINTMN